MCDLANTGPVRMNLDSLCSARKLDHFPLLHAFLLCCAHNGFRCLNSAFSSCTGCRRWYRRFLMIS